MFSRQMWLAGVIALHPIAAARGDVFHRDTGRVIRGTEGMTPFRDADFSRFDLSGAMLSDLELTGSSFVEATLTGADLSGAVLDADFTRATLAGANLSDAEVKGGRFPWTTLHGFSADQLYSTASYRQGDLRGINLSGNGLSGWNFTGQNLTGAAFDFATLRGAELSGAEINGASFWGTTSTGFTAEQLQSSASYQRGNLTEIGMRFNNLSGWDFSHLDLTAADFGDADLTNANFENANLTLARFSDATLSGTVFIGTNLSRANLASSNLTLGELNRANLSGAILEDAWLTGADISSANLSGANFLQAKMKEADLNHAIARRANFTDADLTQAQLSRADLSNAHLSGANFDRATLGEANFQMADLRGASGLAPLDDDQTRNTIWPSGDVFGLDLRGGRDALDVWPHEISITIADHFLMDKDSRLRFTLSGADGSSTIKLADGVTPVLGGTLILDLPTSRDRDELQGKTFNLFDWNGPIEAGNRFRRVLVPLNTQWDFSSFYRSGEATLINAVDRLQAGDADLDLDFDQLDLIRVQLAGKYLTGQPATWGQGDWDGAPGGSPTNPPTGDGLFNQLDAVAALRSGNYLAGAYAAVKPHRRENDNQTYTILDSSTDEGVIDASAGIELTSVNIDSVSGIFTGEAAANLNGSFNNDADSNIFEATFGGSFGSVGFGKVAPTGLSEDFVLGDLSVVGSLAGGGDLGYVDSVYVPEPTSSVLLATGLVIGLLHIRRTRR